MLAGIIETGPLIEGLGCNLSRPPLQEPQEQVTGLFPRPGLPELESPKCHGAVPASGQVVPGLQTPDLAACSAPPP